MIKRISALTLALVIGRLCFAHAILLEAKPKVNGVVSGPDIDVELRFNSRIDSARSRLTLVLPDRTVRMLTLQSSTTPASLDTRLTGLRAGEYKLRWQVLASDGHITRGEIPFRVQ
jgi:methionine-rich copper-binding protein CopC